MNSLDPRVNRLPKTGQPGQINLKAPLDQFGTFEVFVQPRELFTELDVLEHAVCPRCDSTNTELRNIFGATLCRSIHYCNDCKEAFEQFKPL